MVDLAWKDVALALLGICWSGVCWWCKRMQKRLEASDREFSRMRENLPIDYVCKNENTEQLRRIEDKLDRLVERMLP